MKIYYIKKDKFLKTIDRKELEKFSDGRIYKSESKYLEHLIGLYLAKTVAQKYYGIKDTTIILKNKKPVFKNGEICFSISHSRNLAVVAFSQNNIGADVEYMAQRDFKSLLERYDIHIENPTKYDFYKFWTKYESGIKLGTESKSDYSTIIEDNYALSCSCETPLTSDFELIEISL